MSRVTNLLNCLLFVRLTACFTLKQTLLLLLLPPVWDAIKFLSLIAATTALLISSRHLNRHQQPARWCTFLSATLAREKRGRLDRRPYRCRPLQRVWMSQSDNVQVKVSIRCQPVLTWAGFNFVKVAKSGIRRRKSEEKKNWDKERRRRKKVLPAAKSAAELKLKFALLRCLMPLVCVSMRESERNHHRNYLIIGRLTAAITFQWRFSLLQRLLLVCQPASLPFSSFFFCCSSSTAGPVKSAFCQLASGGICCPRVPL